VAVDIFRAAAGLSGISAGLALLWTGAVERQLGITILVIGAFALAHLATDNIFALLNADSSNPGGLATPPRAGQTTRPPPSGRSAPSPASSNDGAPSGFVESAAFYVTTPAVVLGLLTVFGDKNKPTITLKVGSLALAATLLIGLTLHMYAAALKGDARRAQSLVSLLANLAHWGLAFGIIAIALSIVYE
jgi:hypothetical protein